jgi:hypothetical protein
MIILTDIINNQLIKQIYIGYSKKEANQRFNKYKKQLKYE